MQRRVAIIATGAGQLALAHVLTRSDFEVAAMVDPDARVAAEVRRARPDLALVDLAEPNRLSPLLDDITHGGSPVPTVVLADDVDRPNLVRMIAQGVRGFLLRENVAAEIDGTLRDVLDGGVVIDPAVAGQLVADITRGIRLDGPFGLTRQEEQVLAELAAELTNKQIGQRIGISSHTVKTHLRNTFTKLGVRDRVEAALFATEHGLA